MGYSRTNPVGAVGEATKKTAADTLFNNAEALRSVGSLVADLGGDYTQSSNTDTTTPGSNIPGYLIAQVDADKLTASHFEAFFEINAWNDNVTHETHVELYNITDAVVEATIDLQDTTQTRRRSSAITLPAGNKEYKALYYVDNVATSIFVASAKIVFV